MPNCGKVHRWICLVVVASGVKHVGSILLRNAPLAVGSSASCSNLNNKQSHFTIDIAVGTPPQQFEIVADTGSNEVIVKSCICGNFSKICAAQPECFQGTGRSTTFVAPKKGWQDSLIIRSFGSGDIITAVSTDVVQVGKVSAMMKEGLLLMIDRKLMFPGPFEGILGLGIPTWALPGYKKSHPNLSHRHFLEAANTKFFSVCFNDASKPGTLRFEPPPAPKMLKHAGIHHWGLAFDGISVGSETAPVAICDPKSKKAGQKAVCGAIPDSGTTLMMGPQAQIFALYTDICQRWSRCNEAVKIKHGLKASRPAYALMFKQLLTNCNQWLGEGKGLAEVPSLFLHLAGEDGEKQTLELTSWAYITKRLSVDMSFNSKPAVPFLAAKAVKQRACEPLFGELKYFTKTHGPMWILGTPLFFEYQVVFGMKPAAIGFSNQTCKSCGQDAPVVPGQTNFAIASDTSMPRNRNGRVMREMDRKPRMPTFDLTGPL